MDENRKITNMNELIDKMYEISAESGVYRKIAAYIEQSYMKIIFMTANSLAQQLSISQGSVSKFCIALGFNGYSDFLRNLQKIVEKQITAPERLEFATSSESKVDDILDKEIDNILSIKEIIGSEEYQKFVEELASAKEVVLISSRFSATLLPYMKYMLDKIRNKVFMITPDSNEWEYLELHHDKKDTFIVAVGFPRYPRVLVDKVKDLKEKDYKIGVITDSRYSPLCDYSQVKVFVTTTIDSLFDIYSTPLALMNFMLKDTARMINDITSRMQKIEDLDNSNRIYYK